MSNRVSVQSLLVVAGLCGSALAQSGPGTVPPIAVPSQPSHDSRNEVPVVRQFIQLSGQIVQIQTANGSLMAKIIIPVQPTNETCYAIRSFNFVQDGASPDAVRFKDSTVCEPATKARMKFATSPR